MGKRKMLCRFNVKIVPSNLLSDTSRLEITLIPTKENQWISGSCGNNLLRTQSIDPSAHFSVRTCLIFLIAIKRYTEFRTALYPI